MSSPENKTEEENFVFQNREFKLKRADVKLFNIKNSLVNVKTGELIPKNDTVSFMGMSFELTPFFLDDFFCTG